MHQVRAAVSPHQQRIFRDTGARYARQAADFLEQFTRERDGSRAAVACRRRIDIENEQPFRHEAEIDIAEVRHRSQEQPRSGQEDQRYGHLCNHEHRPEPLSDAAGRSSGAKRRDASGSRRLPGGRKAEQDRCRQRNQPDETQKARVDRDRNNEAGPVRRNQSKERVGAHPRERDAGGAAECRKHHAFGQKLTNEPWPAHPEREAHVDFTSSCRGACEQEVCDVGAGDEEHQDDGAHEELEGARKSRSEARQASGGRLKPDSRLGDVAPCVLRRIRSEDVAEDAAKGRGELRLRAECWRTRPDAPDDPEPARTGLASRFRPGTIWAHIVRGIHNSGAAPTCSPKKPGGATPTIVIGVPLMRTTRLRTTASRPNRRCQ